MSVRTSLNYTYTPTGPKTATIKAKAHDQQPDTPPQVAQHAGARPAVIAFIEALFGIPTFAPPPQPRYPAEPSKKNRARHDGPGGGTVFKFTNAQRQDNATFIRTAVLLFVIVGPEGIFVGGISVSQASPAPRAPHAPQLPRLTFTESPQKIREFQRPITEPHSAERDEEEAPQATPAPSAPQLEVLEAAPATAPVPLAFEPEVYQRYWDKLNEEPTPAPAPQDEPAATDPSRIA